ncbi:toxin [Streptomyces sp. NRRL S-444]|nr:toxin [Streptomyces sp. NRRL S-444]
MSIKPSAEIPSALTWVKSSYSTNDGPACIEVAWTKSSYSTNDGPECVEVAQTAGTVLVRDSKRPDGDRLAVAPAAWDGFVTYATA